MSSTVFLRGAELRVLKTVVPKEGSPFLRAHFRSDITQEILDEMGWEPVVQQYGKQSPLLGRLDCTSIVVTPNNQQFSAMERCIDVDYIDDFKACAVMEEGEVADHVLSWAARISHADSVLALVNISLALGRAPLLVKVSNASRGKSKNPDAGNGKDGVDDGSDDEDSPQMRLGETEEPGGQFVQAAEEEEIIPEVLVTETQEAPLATAREAAGGTHARGRKRDRKSTMNPLPSAPGDGEGEGDGVQRAIPGKGEGWHANITVVERDGVLGWTVAVTILAGPKVEAANTDAPPLSIPAAVQEAAEYAAEWAGYQMDKADKEFKFAAAQIRSWALNAKADNRTSEPVAARR